MRNFYKEDGNLKRLMKDLLSKDFFHYANEKLDDYGALCATDIERRAVHTDREGQPKLIRYDKMGNEVSKVWVNEGYRQSVKDSYNTGIVGYIHKEIPELGHNGNYVYAYALTYLLSQTEPGLACPVTLTKASAYLIDHYASEQLKATYLPHVLATGDMELYEGATFLTERQGGSDVGANAVEAVKEAAYYRLTGEKYFASNAGNCGLAMVLARLQGAPKGTKGLSLFLVPWEKNRASGRLRIRRLKDKLGVRAVPSAEVEFDGAVGYLVGEENKGFYYMIEALNLSRVSNAVASLGIMRRAFSEAKQYAQNREAFGQQLIDFPMVRETLGNMVAKQEVEMNAVFEVIRLMDRVMGSDANVSQTEQILFRLYVAIMKKETAEQAVHFAHEAIEMHGGNGYIEDFVTPRLLRDAQVLTVWEGTANILGLEVLRLMNKYEADRLFMEEIRKKLRPVQAVCENTAGCQAEKELLSLLETELDAFVEFVEKVKSCPNELQTFYAKKIAKRMADIFECVVALQAFCQNDERQKAIAKVYLDAVLKEGVSEDPVVLEEFERVI